MTAADHPSMTGDGKQAQYVCPARRRLPIGDETWFLDCVLRNGHAEPHSDIRGRRWEIVG